MKEKNGRQSSDLFFKSVSTSRQCKCRPTWKKNLLSKSLRLLQSHCRSRVKHVTAYPLAAVHWIPDKFARGQEEVSRARDTATALYYYSWATERVDVSAKTGRQWKNGVDEKTKDHRAARTRVDWLRFENEFMRAKKKHSVYCAR